VYSQRLENDASEENANAIAQERELVEYNSAHNEEQEAGSSRKNKSHTGKKAHKHHRKKKHHRSSSGEQFSKEAAEVGEKHFENGSDEVKPPDNDWKDNHKHHHDKKKVRLL